MLRFSHFQAERAEKALREVTPDWVKLIPTDKDAVALSTEQLQEAKKIVLAWDRKPIMPLSNALKSLNNTYLKFLGAVSLTELGAQKRPSIRLYVISNCLTSNVPQWGRSSEGILIRACNRTEHSAHSHIRVRSGVEINEDDRSKGGVWGGKGGWGGGDNALHQFPWRRGIMSRWASSNICITGCLARPRLLAWRIVCWVWQVAIWSSGPAHSRNPSSRFRHARLRPLASQRTCPSVT